MSGSSVAMARNVLGVEGDPRDPLASPLFADLHGLPPLLLQVGDRETLLSDSTAFADKARAAGVAAQLEVWDGMIHVFQQFPAELDEAREARQSSRRASAASSRRASRSTSRPSNACPQRPRRNSERKPSRCWPNARRRTRRIRATARPGHRRRSATTTREENHAHQRLPASLQPVLRGQGGVHRRRTAVHLAAAARAQPQAGEVC